MRSIKVPFRVGTVSSSNARVACSSAESCIDLLRSGCVLNVVVQQGPVLCGQVIQSMV